MVKELISHEKENVAKYIANNQYEDPINILKNTLCKTYPSEFEKLLLDTILEYLNFVAKEVDELLLDKNYVEAQNLVLTVEKTLGAKDGDYPTLDHLKNKVDSHHDIQLGSLKVVSSEENIALNPDGELTKGSLSDTFKYSNANLIKKSGAGDSSMEFYLGKEYLLLEVTLAVSEEAPSKQNSASVTF